MKNSVGKGETTILEHFKEAFERDWRSRYAKRLHGNRDRQKKFANIEDAEMYTEIHEENVWNHALFE